MEFFKSPEDLQGWVRSQESADAAASKIMDITGRDEEQDIVDTCRSIFDQKEEDGNASTILFGVLAKHNLTPTRESSSDDQMVREAQIYRGEAALYQDMPLRVCPKLPRSVGRVVNTIHCRDRCLDSLVLDDDPKRVYCAEALWRRHIMDKFSREFKDKDGKWVGGYINSRFHVFPEAGTPANPHVARDGGNPMELANEERSRMPRPHQYSTERRLEEGRGEKTVSLEASDHKMTKIAGVDEGQCGDDHYIHQMFSDMVEMKEEGLKDEDILMNISEHYDITIASSASLYKIVNQQMKRHAGTVYTTMDKTAQVNPRSTFVTKQDLQVIDMQGMAKTLKVDTAVVAHSGDNGATLLEIVDGPDTGNRVTMSGDIDPNVALGMLDDVQNMIQDAADEVGLNEVGLNEEVQAEEFPINEVPQ